ncbi:MAG: sulfurtransferase complex subunit TusB [Gammaproteobacteria bacterium]|nr:sulfurtransferase complex subunit TusB [Gammaproteobacteria bacterium]MBA3731120.1 sulfurtransferase complex subunit TusB [Gammaproteobacteria bacterium]
MTTLHTVNKSPFSHAALESCLRHAITGASILLIEDAVYAALSQTTFVDTINSAMKNLSFYVLEPDLRARGYDQVQVIDGVKLIDYRGFVDLVVEHHSVQAWL